MAEASSILHSETPNTSSDDLIIKTIREIIDSEVGLFPKSRTDNQEPQVVNLSTSLGQIEEQHHPQGQQSASNCKTHLRNSVVEAIDEGKREKDMGNVGGEKKEGKKEKRPRKRGKGLKKGSIHDFERQSVCDCDKRGDKARVVYLREDMEGLRYVGGDEQRKKWIEVYCGLGPVVAKEYDGLVGSGDDGVEENYVNFDPRPQFVKKRGPAADFVGNEHDNVDSEMQNMNQGDHVSGTNGSDLDGTLGGEEDYYDDEDNDEYVSIQRPAFLVTGEPDFDSGPPQDGLEFLRRVRWEAERIPNVKVAKVEKNVLNKEQTLYMPKIPDIAPCPEHIMPSKEWEEVFLADFSELRRALSLDPTFASPFSAKMESTPLAQNITETMILENLDDDDNDSTMIQENLDFCQTDNKTTSNHDLPSLRTILEMEPVARVTMLRKRITTVETMSSLGRTECAWLFALCAAIHTPLDADTSASLRCLLRKCATLRAEKSGLDDEAIMLNILTTISGVYFGQAETG